MTTANTAEQYGKPKNRQIMGTLINNYSSLNVIRFFAAHPRGRFSRLAIIRAIDEDDGQGEIEKAMVNLADAGVLKTEIANKVHYYRLTDEEPIRGIVLKTAELDWRQWELVQVYPQENY